MKLWAYYMICGLVMKWILCFKKDLKWSFFVVMRKNDDGFVCGCIGEILPLK